jgi:hypothetical protein
MANSTNAAVVKSTVFTPSASDILFAKSSVQTLDGLVQRRKQWEATDYKKANEGLYALLADCLGLFNDKFIGASDDCKKALRLDLTAKLKADGVKVQKTTPTLTMFVRFVFGSDRKRAHGYAYVLKAAISHGVSAKDLAAYITAEGGIEEVKRKMVVSEQAQANRATLATAKAAVISAVEQAAVKPLASIAMAGISGKYALLLAQPTPDGMVNIVGVLPEAQDALVDALIAKMAKRKVNDDEAAAALNKESTDLMGASAEAANAPVVAKQA